MELIKLSGTVLSEVILETTKSNSGREFALDVTRLIRAHYLSLQRFSFFYLLGVQNKPIFEDFFKVLDWNCNLTIYRISIHFLCGKTWVSHKGLKTKLKKQTI